MISGRLSFALAAALAGAALTGAAGPARASMGGGGGDGGGGGSSMGDSWLNDMVRNPRYIEPYAHLSPNRYRVYHPGEGFDDRQAAAAQRRGHRGRGKMRPYR